MQKPAESLGAEGTQEFREEALDKIRAAHFAIQGEQFEFRGSNRIRIKSLQIFVEFEYDGVPVKDFAFFRGNA